MFSRLSPSSTEKTILWYPPYHNLFPTLLSCFPVLSDQQIEPDSPQNQLIYPEAP